MKSPSVSDDTVRKCRFAYAQGGRAYTQTLACELAPKVAE
jgi:hypothetical protein